MLSEATKKLLKEHEPRLTTLVRNGLLTMMELKDAKILRVYKIDKNFHDLEMELIDGRRVWWGVVYN
jgi:hypothetical protein